MGKITFHADGALVEHLDHLDTSKNGMMREAFRQCFDELEHDDDVNDIAGPDGALSARVEGLVGERLGERPPVLVEEAAVARGSKRPTPSDLNINININGPNGEPRVNAGVDTESALSAVRKTRDELEPDDADDPDIACGQRDEPVGPDHVYCPSCGEKTPHRMPCECGDELRLDWAFRPDCGRRTSAAGTLEQA